MARKRDVVGEILEKKQRLLAGAPRIEQFNKRVHPLVAGFREMHGKEKSATRDEWLKYGAIGYVACIEGYLRLLVADLIDHGDPYLSNVAQFNDLRLKLEPITAVQSGRITFGEFVSHMVPISSVEDIDHRLSALLSLDFLSHLNKSAIHPTIESPFEESFPDANWKPAASVSTQT